MLRSIQIVRAVAVIGVMLCHLEWVRNDIQGATASLGEGWLLLGHGVDLFFCVSGFIIAYLLTESQMSLRDFLSRRILRIYPLYWAFTLSYVLAVSLACRVGQREKCPHDFDPLNWASSLLILPQRGEPLLSVGWSLEHEVIFYAIAGIACIALRMSILRLFQVMVLMGGVGVVVHVLAPELLGVNLWDYHLFSLYHFEFAAGIAVFLMKDKLANTNVVLLTGLGLLMFAATGVLSELMSGAAGDIKINRAGWSGLVSVLGYAVASAAILSGLLGAEAKGWFRNGTAWTPIVTGLVLIGNASYALYLVQPLAYGVIGKIYRAAHVDASLLIPALALTICVTLIAGAAWFALIERPFLRMAHRALTPAAQASA
jgi:exopolysaccharide production protein ExoZ